MAETTPKVSAQQARFGATAGLYTVVFIAILVAINWLSTQYNHAFDLTANKRFTLSAETEKLMKGLKGDAKITYFDEARSLDPAKGLLDRYRNLSSKIHIELVDVRTNPIRAREYGVRFAGTATVDYDGRREQAKSFDEQGITGAFIKISKGVRKVCVVTGGQEHALDQAEGDGLSGFKTLMERDNYQPEAITLIDKAAVPDGCKVVVIAGPKADYTPNEVTAVKKFVENGGRLMALVDPPLDFKGEHIAPNTALTDLFASWGVTLEKDLIFEDSAVSQIYGPGSLLISRYESHPIVSELKAQYTILPLMRSLDVKNAPKTNVSKLFSTSPDAVAVSDLSNGRISIDDPKNKKGPFVLGAAGTYDTGKPGDSGRFMIVGGSGFAANGTIAQGVNRDLAVNAINWLSSDEDLISIRAKEPEDRRLDPRGMNIFAYTDLLAIPLFVIILGIAIYMKRR